MTQFELLAESTRDFGPNSYVEVSRKRVQEDEGSASEFILVTRGFYEKDGTKRWTKFVTLPVEPELRDWLAQALQKI